MITFLNLVFFFVCVQEGTACLGIGSWENTETEIRFSDIYAVEFDSYGLVHSPKSGLGHAKECFRKQRLLTSTQQVFLLSF